MTNIGLWPDAGATRWSGRPAGAEANARHGRRAGFLLVCVLALSGLMAALQLCTSLYMLAVYDQVLPSGSATALAALTGLVVLLHAAFAALDMIRARVVCRAGLRLVEVLDGHVLKVLQGEAANARGLAPLDDVERVRRFLTGAAPCAVLDVLWLPAFLGTVFLLHPALGFYAVAVALLLAGLTVAAEVRQRAAGQRLLRTRHTRYVLAWDLYAQRRASDAHGRRQDPVFRWQALSRSYAELTSSAQDRVLSAAALGKGLRLALLSAGLGLGALLAIEGLLSPGALFASSLILARTFACLDAGLAHWRGFVAAQDSYARLEVAVRG